MINMVTHPCDFGNWLKGRHVRYILTETANQKPLFETEQACTYHMHRFKNRVIYTGSVILMKVSNATHNVHA